MTPVLLSEGGYQEFTLSGGDWVILVGAALTAVLALVVGYFLMQGVLAADKGTPKMIEIADAIQEGAMAYLKRQFKTIAVILIPLAIVVFVTSVGREEGRRHRGALVHAVGPVPQRCASSAAASCRASRASSA